MVEEGSVQKKKKIEEGPCTTWRPDWTLSRAISVLDQSF